MESHPLSDNFADLVESKSPSVVNVFTVQKPQEKNSNQNPLEGIPPQFRDFFKTFPPCFPFVPRPQQPYHLERERSQALCSGFVIDPTRYIVTNNHVIQQSNQIKVKFHNYTALEAKLV